MAQLQQLTKQFTKADSKQSALPRSASMGRRCCVVAKAQGRHLSVSFDDVRFLCLALDRCPLIPASQLLLAHALSLLR